MFVVLSASFVLLGATPEAPALYDVALAEGETTTRYRDCVGRVKSAAPGFRTAAERWATEGGGAAAQHCLALAELASGHPRMAAARLEALAQRSDAGDQLVRARILSQAALAWLDGEKTSEAESAVNAAFAAAPDAAELRLTRAQIYLAQKRHQAAIDDVGAAEAEGYVSARGFVVRGRARHALLSHRDAADDVVAALSLDPLNIDALTLRGDLAQAGVEIDAFYSEATKR